MILQWVKLSEFSFPNEILVNSSILNTSQMQRQFGDRLYNNQSASTLTHSITSYSIPKQDRFDKYSTVMSQGSMYNLKSTLDTRGTTVGNGSRASQSHKQLAIIASQPSPNHYICPAAIERGIREGRGKSFGLSYQYYSKACPSGITDFMSPSETKGIPGPGAYKTDKQFGLGKPKYTVNKRGKMFNERLKTVSPGAIYELNHNLVERGRYGSGVGFGYGGRSDFSKSGPNVNPGPGNYKLPSIFDKYYSK